MTFASATRLADIGTPPQIAIFDTAIATRNAGDHIIMDAVEQELSRLFPLSPMVSMPTHDRLGDEAYRLLSQSAHAFVGGTNLLASHMDAYRQWRLGGDEMLRLRDLILLAVGWWQYQDGVNDYTKLLLGRILHRTRLHSVRDAYTARKLAEAGLENCINTGCVTTWMLDADHVARLPEGKGEAALLTFTDYKPDVERDRKLYAQVRRHYDRVLFWIQGAGDLDYARSILAPDTEMIGPTLPALDAALAGVPGLDYVGTRLHAGIRALQHGRRTVIIAVDNRAAEMGTDMGLPVVQRGDEAGLERAIAERAPSQIRIPQEAIQRWRAQFHEVRR